MIDLAQHWWPVATSRELRAKQPLGRVLCCVPIALFRDGAGNASALLDRCPHRGAPLSAGRTTAGELECAYHGWRFDASGRCTQVPGLCEELRARSPATQAFAVAEAGGLVWVSLVPQAAPPDPLLPGGPGARDWFFLSDRVASGMAEAAENFLDGFHTHFVHAGLVRSARTRRRVAVRVSPLAGGVEARYGGEGVQSGWISRIFERERSESFGRFRLPGIAEIEYRNARGPTLIATAWISPEDATTVRAFVRVLTPRALIPAPLKEMVLARVFRAVFRQDKRILELVSANAARFEHLPAAAGASARHAKQMDSPLDLLAPHIRALLAGEPLDEARFGEREVLL